MKTWDRFELVDKLKLKFVSLTNTDDPIYTYRKGLIMVNLRHFGQQYWFAIKDDFGDEFASMTFEDYTNRDKFMTNFDRFCKFFKID